MIFIAGFNNINLNTHRLRAPQPPSREELFGRDLIAFQEIDTSPKGLKNFYLTKFMMIHVSFKVSQENAITYQTVGIHSINSVLLSPVLYPRPQLLNLYSISSIP